MGFPFFIIFISKHKIEKPWPYAVKYPVWKELKTHTKKFIFVLLVKDFLLESFKNPFSGEKSIQGESSHPRADFILKKNLLLENHSLGSIIVLNRSINCPILNIGLTAWFYFVKQFPTATQHSNICPCFFFYHIWDWMTSYVTACPAGMVLTHLRLPKLLLFSFYCVLSSSWCFVLWVVLYIIKLKVTEWRK